MTEPAEPPPDAQPSSNGQSPPDAVPSANAEPSPEAMAHGLAPHPAPAPPTAQPAGRPTASAPAQRPAPPPAEPPVRTGTPAPDATTPHIPVTRLTPLFKLVFLTVLGCWTITLAINVVMVILIDDPSEQAKSLIDTCSTIVKTGFGAMVGLIGGKAA